MNNQNTNPKKTATLLDELAFARGGSFEIVGSVMRAEECYCRREDRGLDIGRLMSILEHGLMIGSDLYNEAEHLAETSPSAEELVRCFFHAVCAGEDVRQIFRYPGDNSENDVFPYDSGWDWLYGNQRKEKILVTQEIAMKATSMALDASRLMSKLSPAAEANREYDLTLVARLAMRTPTGTLVPGHIEVEASYDYVKLNPGRDVFVGAYEVAPFFSVSEVRRHAGLNHWGARAYLGKLLASAYFGLPIEWRYVVASSKPCYFNYVNAKATSTDHLTCSFSQGCQEGPYPCRAYDIGSASLDEGRIALHRALYRLCYQNASDAVYLRHETI
jgi:hypothetical protein